MGKVLPPLAGTSLGVLGMILLAMGHAPVAHGQSRSPNDSVQGAAVHGMQWRSIGPSVTGGRISDLEVIQSEQTAIYVGAASGGVFKSVNHGTSWTPVFDDAANLSIGAISVAPSDDSVVWVGTGEPNNRNSSPVGRGVYRSTDAGKSWEFLGLEETRHIGDILVHPDDPHTAWVAALGHLFGPNPARGIYRTTDGGRTWSKVLYIDQNTGVVDLERVPGQPETILAAAYQRRRRAYGFVGGGPASGVYRTTDAGDTWTEITAGLPEGNKGRIGFNAVKARPNTILAMVEARKGGGVYRSVDRGESWEKVNDLNPRPMYYSQVRAAPNDPDRIYVLGTRLHLSEDGGKTFREVELSSVYNIGVHSDHHDLWINPEDSRHMVLGNDGGVYFSHDGGKHWEFAGNLPIGQFYDITYDWRTPYRVYGGLQDNQSIGGPNETHRYKGILGRDWTVVGFGDGMYQQVDPSDGRTLYTSSQGGAIIRFDLKTGDRKDIMPVASDSGEEYRFDWTSPIRASRHSPSTLYFGGNRLFISRDQGATWSETKDLTRDLDRDTLPIMGAVPDSGALSLHDGVGGFSEITTVAESPVRPGVLWVGTDDGNVQVSRDGGKSWREVGDFPGIHKDLYVSRVEASHRNPARAYVTLDGHWRDDYQPYVFATHDYGRTWRDISPNGEVGAAKVVREHPHRGTVLFLGTSTGVLYTANSGRTWGRLNLNMPQIPVWDLEIHPREMDLIAGTHGRSIWILDDIESVGAASPKDRLRLVDTGEGELFQYWNSVPTRGHGNFRGENPPFGAHITFVASGESDSADVVVRSPKDRLFDADTLRHIRIPVRDGVNRVYWDLRLDSLPMDTSRYERPGLSVANEGPLVPPAVYPVEVSAGRFQDHGTIKVQAAPGLPASSEELRDRYRFRVDLQEFRSAIYGPSVRAYELVEEANRAVDTLQSKSRADTSTLSAADSLLGEFESVADSLRAVKGDLLGWWRGLTGDFVGGPSTQGTMTGPTASQRRRLHHLKERFRNAESEFRGVVDRAVPALNRLLRQYGVPELEEERNPTLH